MLIKIILYTSYTNIPVQYTCRISHFQVLSYLSLRYTSPVILLLPVDASFIFSVWLVQFVTIHYFFPFSTILGPK